MRGRTLGIIGLGKIGQAVADRARGLEMTVIGYDPFVTAEQAALHSITLADVDTIIEQADVITVHVPLNKGTRGLINADNIGKFKPTVMLINVARGGVYDEAAVAKALTDGKIAGAAFDGAVGDLVHDALEAGQQGQAHGEGDLFCLHLDVIIH